jgi:hypothetical protein
LRDISLSSETESRPTVKGVRVPFFKDHPSLRPPRQTVGRVLVVLSPTDADVRTVRTLGRRLRRYGVEVDAASECHGEVHGEHGEFLNPNLLLVDAAQRDWDAVVVGGGAGAADVVEDQLARDIVRRAAERQKPLAAIGDGRAVLERAGVDGFASDDGAAIARFLCDRLGAGHGLPSRSWTMQTSPPFSSRSPT